MANYNLSLPAETIDSLLLWLDDKQGIIIKQTDLLSGTGQSTTATMTQKAITDALGTKADASSVYTKTQTDTLLGGKADKSTTYTKTETDTLLNGKVDKEVGKGLSTNDYTDADKTKLGALPTAAELDSELAVLAGEAGLAEAVIDTDNAGTEQEFTFRKSGGDGGAYYRKIKGKSVGINQLVNSIGSTETKDGLTFTLQADGSYIVNGTASADGYKSLGFATIYNGNHKFFLGCPSGCSATTYYLGYGNLDDDTVSARIVNQSYWANSTVEFKYKNGAVVNNVHIYPQIIDLTLAGLDTLTAVQFLALYPNPLPHNPGTLISNDAEAVETTGVNQWDEEWESGKWDVNTGDSGEGVDQIRCKNFIPVIGGSVLYFKSPTYIWVLEYDANLNYLHIYQSTMDDTLTLNANTRYIKFYTLSYGATYNHDICINLSNPAINGQYFPYWKRTLQLGLTTRKDTDGNVPFADGMKGAGTAADWCNKVGGEKRMRRVDLGSLNMFDLSAAPLFSIQDSIGIKPAANNGIANIICPKYAATSRDDISTNNAQIAINAGGVIIINDNNVTSGMTTAQIKEYLSGVFLDFELATPVPFTWAEPLNLGVKVDENGTERAVAPEGATAPSAPFVADTTYTMSVARMVEILKNL